VISGLGSIASKLSVGGESVITERLGGKCGRSVGRKSVVSGLGRWASRRGVVIYAFIGVFY